MHQLLKAKSILMCALVHKNFEQLCLCLQMDAHLRLAEYTHIKLLQSPLQRAAYLRMHLLLCASVNYTNFLK